MPDNTGLSPDTISKFSKLLDQMDSVLERQLEITEKVLKLEGQIATERMANLTKYFDSYSRALDGVARKQSNLGDGFLILSEKIDKATKNMQDSVSGAANLSFTGNGQGGNPPAKPGGGKGGGGSTSGGGSSSGEEPTKPKGRTYNSKAQVNDSDLPDEVSLGVDGDTLEKSMETRRNTLEEVSRLTQSFRDEEKKREDAVLTDDQARLTSLASYRAKKYQEMGEAQRKLFKDIETLAAMSSDTEMDRQDRLAEHRLTTIKTITDAEIAAQDLVNKFTTEINYAGGMDYQEEVFGQQQSLGYNEAGAAEAQRAEAEALVEYMQELEEKKNDYIARRERELRLKNNGVLTKQQATAIQKEVAQKFKLDKENLRKLAAEKTRLDAAEAAADERDKMRSLTDTMMHGKTTTERYKAMKELTTNEAGEFDMKKTMTAAVLAVSDLAKQLEGKIDEIGSYKKDIDTRLQGSSNKKFMGSYWDQLTRDMMSVGAVTPFFKQSDFASNIKSLVDTGIAFDLKQRAFLMTIQEKIANTFDVADGTLLRLVRIQQEDSTAGRLGMESALNSFLNNMYENTEYLKSVADGVRGSLEEMQSLLKGAEAAEIEYQVQKWMGSLYSVGMSQNAVNAITTALGQIAAGQIEGLTGGGAGNLLIMAANDAGIPIADILTKGVNADETNRLLEATVDYLAEIAKASEDNRVVQQQLADVFGVKASDLRAATNLASSMSGISGNSLSYGGMLKQLENMANTMFMRTSVGEMMTNIWENGTYSVASSMAGNPVSYMIYKVAKVLDDAAGGIDLPFLNVMGFGVDLNTTVSDLMRLAAVGGGLLGSLGPMISGLASSFSGQSMLRKMGIASGSNLEITPRGSGEGLAGAGGSGGGSSSTSSSGYVGNSSGSDVKDATIQESEDSKKQQMIEATEEAEENQVDVLNETVIKIYELLDEVASGKATFTVKVEEYGLTKTSSKQNGAMAGLDALANAGSGSSGNSLSGGSSGGASGNGAAGGLSGTGAGGSMDFGGWVST